MDLTTLLLFILSIIAATIPYLILILFIWWMDRYEREPIGYVFLSLIWGGVGAIIIGIIFSIILLIPTSMLVGQKMADILGSVLIAPLVEEPAKIFILILLVKSLNFDNATDGFVYGAATGLGFAMTENFLYFTQGISGGLQNWIVLVLLRTFFTGIMHMITCSIFGAILGYVKYNKSVTKKILFPIGGLLLGMIIHAVWNTTAVAQAVYPNSYSLIIGIVMLFIAFIIIVITFLLSVSHERKIIIKYLTLEAKDGLIPEKHIYYISHFLKRNKGNWINPIIRKKYIDFTVHLAFRQDQLAHVGNPKKIEILKKDIVKLREDIKQLLGGE